MIVFNDSVMHLLIDRAPIKMLGFFYYNLYHYFFYDFHFYYFYLYYY